MTKFKLRITNYELRFIFVFFALFVVCFILTSCEQKIQPSVVNLFEANAPSQESWNSEVTISDSGINRAVLNAGHISVFENEHVTLLDSGVVVDFFDNKGMHTSKMNSRTGKVNDKTNDLEASGNVVIVSDSGTVVKTQKIFWDNATQKVHSNEYVEITSPRENLHGYGFESDQDLKNYKVFRVTGKAKVKEE